MSTAKFDTLQNAAGSVSVPVNTVVNGSAKAWVNFNGTGTVAIRAGFNVSSITDNAVGDYTVNFTTAMPDANYSPQLTGYFASTGEEGSFPLQSFSTAPATNLFRFVNGVPGTSTSTVISLRDAAYLNVAIFR